MSSEEREEGTKLVELNKQVISDVTVEARYVSTSEGVTAYPCLEEHIDGALKLAHCCSVVSCPVGSESLTAQEEGTSQNESSSFVVVSGQETSPRAALLQCSVHIMNVTILERATVGLPVDILHRHGLCFRAKDGWLIHIVPEVVQII